MAGVEPTNNAAEREVRHAVCWRKTSYGTDSAAGSRFVERILTVIGDVPPSGAERARVPGRCGSGRQNRDEGPVINPAGRTWGVNGYGRSIHSTSGESSWEKCSPNASSPNSKASPHLTSSTTDSTNTLIRRYRKLKEMSLRQARESS